MATRRSADQSGTRTAILDVAERLVQHRGFNGFSYADVAAELGVTTAALHYHFPGKAELGEALITRYAQRFGEALEGIDAMDVSIPTKLRAYSDLYLGVLRDQRMCLCGMLAAEYQTLPEAMRAIVVRFFDNNHAWLAGLLEAGRTERSLHFAGTAPAAAQMIVGALEGAMLVARPYADLSRFQVIADGVIGGLANQTDVPRRRR